ncbi:MAG: aminoacyl-tRNA hydrolase [Deltaproteobacteria bacterium]|nr:aminoacyl-tRNA hydrolase [Deltaproteobacteria bacterium]
MTALKITDTLSIPDKEMQFSYCCSGGPGGQNVNKVETGVHLRFNFRHSESLPPHCRARLEALADSRVGKDGTITIKAQRYRTREQNRDDALNRLAHMLRKAAAKPKVRHATRPTAGSRKLRLEEKKKRGQAKILRKKPTLTES